MTNERHAKDRVTPGGWGVALSLAALTAIAILCAVYAGCTVVEPLRIEYSSSSVELQKIQRWQLEAEPHIRIRTIGGQVNKQLDASAQARIAEYSTEWVDEIRTRLSHDKQFTFYDNPPTEGTIHLTFYGQLRPDKKSHPNAATGRVAPTAIRDQNSEMHTEESVFPVEYKLEDRIDSVIVVIANAEKKNLGQIKMTRPESDWLETQEIKANRVADAIDKMVHGTK